MSNMKNIYENLDMDNDTEVLEFMLKELILDFINNTENEATDNNSWD